MNRHLSFSGVCAVWQRHFRLYRKTWLVNCLPPLSEPIVYLTAFGLGMSPLVREVQYLGRAVSYLEFLAPGMIAVGVLFQSFFEAAYGTFIRQRFQMTWQAMLTTPLTAPEVFAGDLLWAATKGIFAGTATGIVAVIWGIYPASALLISFPLICAGSLVFAAAGIFAAFTVRSVDQLNIPIFLFVVPMFALCGTYFPRDVLPNGLRQFAGILPLSLLCDLFRWPIGVSPYFSLLLILLVAWGLLFLCAGWVRAKKTLFR